MVSSRLLYGSNKALPGGEVGTLNPGSHQSVQPSSQWLLACATQGCLWEASVGLQHVVPTGKIEKARGCYWRHGIDGHGMLQLAVNAFAGHFAGNELR